MKKILILVLALFTFTGCWNKMANTPTKEVESFLNKYQVLDSSVLEDMHEVVNNEPNLNNEHKERYKEILKNNYQKLKYDIKDEAIDGSNAVVTVEIEVIDYVKTNQRIEEEIAEKEEDFHDDKNEKDFLKIIEYKLEELKKTEEKVTYTLDFTLKKQEDKWVLDKPSSEMIEKINGMYK